MSEDSYERVMMNQAIRSKPGMLSPYAQMQSLRYYHLLYKLMIVLSFSNTRVCLFKYSRRLVQDATILTDNRVKLSHITRGMFHQTTGYAFQDMNLLYTYIHRGLSFPSLKQSIPARVSMLPYPLSLYIRRWPLFHSRSLLLWIMGMKSKRLVVLLDDSGPWSINSYETR